MFLTSPFRVHAVPPTIRPDPEVRQEAVQQAIAAMQNKPHRNAVPMPSKRSSVLASSPVRGRRRHRHASDSSSEFDEDESHLITSHNDYPSPEVMVSATRPTHLSIAHPITTGGSGRRSSSTTTTTDTSSNSSPAIEVPPALPPRNLVTDHHQLQQQVSNHSSSNHPRVLGIHHKSHHHHHNHHQNQGSKQSQNSSSHYYQPPVAQPLPPQQQQQSQRHHPVDQFRDGQFHRRDRVDRERERDLFRQAQHVHQQRHERHQGYARDKEKRREEKQKLLQQQVSAHKHQQQQQHRSCTHNNNNNINNNSRPLNHQALQSQSSPPPPAGSSVLTSNLVDVYSNEDPPPAPPHRSSGGGIASNQHNNHQHHNQQHVLLDPMLKVQNNQQPQQGNISQNKSHRSSSSHQVMGRKGSAGSSTSSSTSSNNEHHQNPAVDPLLDSSSAMDHQTRITSSSVAVSHLADVMQNLTPPSTYDAMRNPQPDVTVSAVTTPTRSESQAIGSNSFTAVPASVIPINNRTTGGGNLSSSSSNTLGSTGAGGQVTADYDAVYGSGVNDVVNSTAVAPVVDPLMQRHSTSDLLLHEVSITTNNTSTDHSIGDLNDTQHMDDSVGSCPSLDGFSTTGTGRYKVSAKIQQLLHTLSRPKKRPLPDFYIDDETDLEIAANQLDPSSPKPEGTNMVPPVGEVLNVPAGLPKSLEEALQRYGSGTCKAPAVTVLDTSGKIGPAMTYGKLLGRARKIAYHLLNKVGQKGSSNNSTTAAADSSNAAASLSAGTVKQGDRIALVFPNSDPFGFMCSFYGCLLAGVVPVPIEVPITRRDAGSTQIGFLLGSCSVRYAITSDACFKGLPKNSTTGEVMSDFKGWPRLQWLLPENWAKAPKDWSPPPRISDDVTAYIEYTVDGDGAMKGVSVSRNAMMTHCKALTSACAYTEGDILISVLDFKREVGLWHSVLTSILNGMHIIFIPYSLMKVNPSSWMMMITKFKSTVAICKSRDLHWGLLATKDHKDINLSSLRMLLVADGSNPWSLSSCDQFINVFNARGLKPESLCPCAASPEAMTISLRR